MSEYQFREWHRERMRQIMQMILALKLMRFQAEAARLQETK